VLERLTAPRSRSSQLEGDVRLQQPRSRVPRDRLKRDFSYRSGLESMLSPVNATLPVSYMRKIEYGLAPRTKRESPERDRDPNHRLSNKTCLSATLN
jgi:hypothetical protein